MAIESDQLVFDYLSRIGDLAQQRQLPSKTRMRLVAELRTEIDRRRATVTGGKTPGDSPAGVRRILDRLGTPEEVVDRAADASDRGEGAGTSPVREPDAVVAAVAQELDNAPDDLPAVCKAISHGSLMGARGNSGVILSQILRGISAVVAVFINTIYSELATMFPEKSGGLALYAHEAWRKYTTARAWS